MSDVWPDDVAGWVDLLANWITLLTVLGALGLAVARRSRNFERYLVAWPIRRSFSRADPSIGRTIDLDRLRRHLVDEALEVGDPRPAHVLATTLDAADLYRWPTDRGPRLAEVLEEAQRRFDRSVVPGLVYPRQVAALRDVLHAVESHARTIEGHQATARPRVAAVSGTDSFARTMSALSGAVVLVDAVETRSRVVDRVLVHHSTDFRCDGRARTYEEHRSDCPAFRQMPDKRPGDFDRRVLDVRSASLVVDPAAYEVAFLLRTSETCYATTELGAPSGGNRPGRGAVGCKHVPVSWDPGAVDLRAVAIRGGTALERHGDGFSGRRTVLLTGYVTVISSDGKVMLARRSRRVRNGRGVLSATAGGVVELGASGDVDADGMPDLRAAVCRESVEEIGLVLDPTSVAAVAVVLANIRGLETDEGQLVVFVLHLATSDLAAHEIEARARDADPRRGSYEQEGLVGIDATSPRSLMTYAAEEAVGLDQHGLLSLAYAAAWLHSPAEAARAAEAAFSARGAGPGPWWNRTADHLPDRLVRDPRLLAPDAMLGDVEPWQDDWPTVVDT